MTAEFRDAAAEVKQLRRCINDLVGIVTLPAIWSVDAPSDIVASLLDVLVSVLRLDFAYARLSESIDGKQIEMFRAAASHRVATQPEEIPEAFSVWLADEPPRWPSRVPHPFGAGDVCVLPFPLGPQGEIGVIVAGSERPDFPDENERLLVSVAVNQATVGLQKARLLSEQKRAAWELDETLAQRTRELATANVELRRIMDAIREAVVVLGPDGRTLDANAFALDYWGLTLEEVRAEDARVQRFHPDDVARLREERRQALLRGEPFEAEQRVRRKDGQYRWFLIRYSPVRNDDGNIIRWYATATDIDDLKRAAERIRNENLALREEVDRSSMFEEIVGSSPPLKAVLAHLSKVAPTDSTVLITGETGTGKELIARAIHKRSPRSARAFVSVNCAAIPASLIASELFGHEKGAFTGALQRRQGRFELADGGTLFLDEVGELPADTQIMLLRVLQEREFERVGGSGPVRVNVRLIAATNRDLQAAVANAVFRTDLFYRLNVFPLEVPALRERRADIPLLVEYFIHRYAKRAAKRIRGISKEMSSLLQSYDWPGNIRELQNVIERAVIVSDSDTLSIDERWLTGRRSAVPSTVAASPTSTLAVQEKGAIEAALAESKGRVSGPFGAAARLGVPSSTLESKIKALKIDKRRFKPRPPPAM
jgi:formate hydrogenlyase transcriptional activator